MRPKALLPKTTLLFAAALGLTGLACGGPLDAELEFQSAASGLTNGPKPIRDLVIAKYRCPNGYRKVVGKGPSAPNGDLNESSGGPDIFLCTSTDPNKGAPIGSVAITNNACPHGYNRVGQRNGSNGDANQSSGGPDIFVCISRWNSSYGGPVGGLYLVENKGYCGWFSDRPAITTGRANGDFNQSSGGKDIYLCMDHIPYTPPPPPPPPPAAPAPVVQPEADPVVRDIVVSLKECPANYKMVAAREGVNLRGELNQEAGGKDIFLCTSTDPSKGEPIRNVTLVERDCPSGNGFSKIPTRNGSNGDLNQGARGSKDIYVCTSRAGSDKPIAELYLDDDRANFCNIPGKINIVPAQHITPLNGDLNQGAGGKDIFLCLDRVAQSFTENFGKYLPEMPLLKGLELSSHVKTISFDKNGHELHYHSIAGHRWQHLQDMVRLPDAHGKHYYMGTYSQNTDSTEGGMVFVGELQPGSTRGQVVWLDVLNDTHAAGGFNHPGDLRVLGNVAVTAGQNWAGSLGSQIATWGPMPGDDMDRGNGGQAVIFYDVSNPKAPEYMGKVSACWKGQELVSPQQDIDSISIAKLGRYYYMAFNGLRCRASAFHPKARWVVIDESYNESFTPTVRYMFEGRERVGGIDLSEESDSIIYDELKHWTRATATREPVLSTPMTRAHLRKIDGTTFNMSVSEDGKGYVVLTGVSSDAGRNDKLLIQEIEIINPNCGDDYTLKNGNCVAKVKVCEDGYLERYGDIPGWGSINGKGAGQTVSNPKECAELCASETACGSYEIGFDGGRYRCNLNSLYQFPTQGQYKEYSLCVKDRS